MDAVNASNIGDARQLHANGGTAGNTTAPLYQLKKVQQSRNRPGVAQRVPGDLGSKISMTFCT